jgi:hypothetical protein
MRVRRVAVPCTDPLGPPECLEFNECHAACRHDTVTSRLFQPAERYPVPPFYRVLREAWGMGWERDLFRTELRRPGGVDCAGVPE